VALTRRRGAELEEALLAAAWDELQEVGYPAFTIEGVAARAGTSKPVLYRRWPTKVDLVLAAMTHAGLFARRELPDTGSLREDVLTALRDFNESRAQFIAAIGFFMASIGAETGMTPSDIRDRLIGGRVRGGRPFLERAAARGEIPARDWSDTLAGLPFDLMRHDLTMTLRPMPERRMLEIVDEVWLPLVRGAVTPAGS
jgi:AcrR family transcriptional regulator